MFNFDNIEKNLKKANIFDEVKVLKTVGSTNNYIKTYDSLGKNLIVFAEKQTNGRGRMGRTWLSDFDGCLMFSFKIPLDKISENIRFVTQLVAICLHKVLLKELGSVSLLIKWPNDLMLNSKKICGILTETVIESKENISLVIGIGLNIKGEIKDENIVNIASTIEKETGIAIDVEKFLCEFFDCFFKSFNLLCDKPFIENEFISYINEYFYLKNKEITRNGVIGFSKGIDELGRLIFDTGYEIKYIDYGEVV